MQHCRGVRLTLCRLCELTHMSVVRFLADVRVGEARRAGTYGLWVDKAGVVDL